MALTQNLNYLQPTGFRILVDSIRFSNFVFFAQSVTHPDLTTSAAEVRYRNYSSVPQIPDTFTYGELNMNVIVDEDMNSYTEIFNWMKTNVENNVRGPEEENSSYADLLLTILSSKNNLNKKIKYVNCFPTNIGSINLESNLEGGTPTITFPVSFRYTYFTIE